MERVVMEEDEAPRADSALEGDRVLHARVPPADFRLVLVLGVLRVMHQQVDLLRDRTAPEIQSIGLSANPASAGS